MTDGELKSLATKIVTEVNENTAKRVKKEVEMIFEFAVDRYYDAYYPEEHGGYKRRYRLYKAFAWDNDYQYFHTGRDTMREGEYDRVDNEYIYHLAFVEGYHGGSMSGASIVKGGFTNPHPEPGVAYWRTHEGDLRWGKWYKPAVKTKPINEIFEELYAEYLDKDFKKKIQEEEFINAIEKYKNELMRDSENK